MNIFRFFSTGICVFGAMILSPVVLASDRLDEHRMARSADVYGYAQYQNNIQNRGPRHIRHDYQVAPNIRPMTNFMDHSDSVNGGMRRSYNRDVSVLNDAADARENVSDIEKFYRQKTGENDLRQWGYDLFTGAAPGLSMSRLNDHSQGDDDRRYVTSPVGAVGRDYAVQTGDELVIFFEGERKDRQKYVVDTSGRLLIDNFPVVMVAGKTLSDVEGEVNRIAISQGYYGSISVSLSAMRQLNIMVSGQVGKPGRYMLGAYHSVLDALHAAGGIRKSGSLRNIKLIRNKSSYVFDLYEFLSNGKFGLDDVLKDGDKIIVPLLGDTIAVTGDVKQAGVFELKSDIRINWRQSKHSSLGKVSVQRMVDIAGGVLSAGQNEISIVGANSLVRTVDNMGLETVSDGDVVVVTRATDRLDNAVRLAGYSRQNGMYDVSDVSTLGALLRDRQAFDADVYPLMGVVTRINPKNLSREIVSFSPQKIARSGSSRPLKGGDVVYLFSYDDVKKIMSDFDKASQTAPHLDGGDEADYRSDVRPNMVPDQKYPQWVRHYVRDNVVSVNGAVWEAGVLPLGGRASVMDVLVAAGGTKKIADTDRVEVVRQVSGVARRTLVKESDLSKINVSAGDQIRVPEEFKATLRSAVRVTGEVVNPGQYDLMRGDTLLSVLQRAGGVTEQAYPAGAVFSRKSERKREEQKFRSAAQRLQQTISMNLGDREKGLSNDQIALAKGLIDDLRNAQAVGRLTVEADPSVLTARPELDLLMEAGDHIHIPKRPINVRVSGEVMNPAALLFEADKDVDDYIAESGGVTYYADKSRKFVVYPDGAAQPVGGWNDKPTMIIPGSTIVIPRDPKPFDFMESFKDITQILTNMAITGVFIEDIATDEN